MAEKLEVKELDQVVVRFSGDSGDGMQLAGVACALLCVDSDASCHRHYKQNEGDCRGRPQSLYQGDGSETPPGGRRADCRGTGEDTI